jgi:hypothetical protein
MYAFQWFETTRGWVVKKAKKRLANSAVKKAAK